MDDKTFEFGIWDIIISEDCRGIRLMILSKETSSSVVIFKGRKDIAVYDSNAGEIITVR